MPLRVKVVRQAERQIEKASSWWLSHRPSAPHAVWQDLQAAIRMIARHPRIGARALHGKLPGVRRIYLRRIRYHLYYRLRKETETIEVLAFWHSSRGTAPEP